MKRYFFLLSVLFLVSCSDVVDVTLTPTVDVYVSPSKTPVATLSAEAPQYQQLNMWLANNNDSWMVTSGRYEGGVYLHAGDIGIQVRKRHVVLYDTTGKTLRAIYIQPFTADELAAITKLGS